MDVPLDVLLFLSAPVRLSGRLFVSLQYIIDRDGSVQHWYRNDYAQDRFGAHYRWRPWLFFDVEELESLEKLINRGSDQDLLKWRESRLNIFGLVAVVGAILAQAAISAHSLPFLAEAHYCARGLFTSSLSNSLLAIFFTYIQHQRLSFLNDPIALRMWLWDGTTCENESGEEIIRSSMVTLSLLRVPYETMNLSLTFFIAGLVVYLGSAFARNLGVSEDGGISVGNLAVLAATSAGIAFSCMLFGYLLGMRGVEDRRCEKNLQD